MWMGCEPTVRIVTCDICQPWKGMIRDCMASDSEQWYYANDVEA